MLPDKQKEVTKRSIIEQSAEMMDVFFRPENKPKDCVQWQKDFKNQTMQLLWQCHFEKIVPPVDLVILTGCLLGDRHNWSYAKFAVLNFLARNYCPTKVIKELPRGTKSQISRIINECGGVLEETRKLDGSLGNEMHDYRSTFDGWVEEDLFFYIWGQKYLHFLDHPEDADALDVTNNALSSMK